VAFSVFAQTLAIYIAGAGEGILNDVFRGVALVGDAAVPLLLIILGLQLAETGKIS
jgi:predicted permease